MKRIIKNSKNDCEKLDENSSFSNGQKNLTLDGKDLIDSQKLLLLSLYTSMALQSHELTLIVLKFLSDNWDIVKSLKFCQMEKTEPFRLLLESLTQKFVCIDELFLAKNIHEQKTIALGELSKFSLNIPTGVVEWRQALNECAKNPSRIQVTTGRDIAVVYSGNYAMLFSVNKSTTHSHFDHGPDKNGHAAKPSIWNPIQCFKTTNNPSAENPEGELNLDDVNLINDLILARAGQDQMNLRVNLDSDLTAWNQPQSDPFEQE